MSVPRYTWHLPLGWRMIGADSSETWTVRAPSNGVIRRLAFGTHVAYGLALTSLVAIDPNPSIVPDRGGLDGLDVEFVKEGSIPGFLLAESIDLFDIEVDEGDLIRIAIKNLETQYVPVHGILLGDPR